MKPSVANFYLSGWNQYKVVSFRCAFNSQMKKRNLNRTKMHLRVSNLSASNSYSQCNSKLRLSKMIKMVKTFSMLVSKPCREAW